MRAGLRGNRRVDALRGVLWIVLTAVGVFAAGLTIAAAFTWVMA